MDMFPFLEKYLPDFTDPKALLAWMCVYVLALVPLDGLFSKYISTPTLPCLYGAGLAVLLTCWLHKRLYIQKTKKGKLGVVISIFVENEFEQKSLKKDLVARLKQNFKEGDLGEIVQTIVIPNHRAETIQNGDTIRKANKRVKAHFWITGTARKRDGRFVMDLEGMVMHHPIATEVSSRLGRDFRSALPKRIEMDEKLAFTLSEFSGDQIYAVSRYITGSAAYLSSNPALALKLHSELLEQLDKLPSPLIPNLQYIRAKLPNLIIEDHILFAFAHFRSGQINDCEQHLREVFAKSPNSYKALILRSNIEVVHSRDAKAALATTIQAQGQAGSDPTWKYNKTYLLLTLGRYTEAVKVARSINTNVSEGELSIVGQVEDFCKNMIKDGTATPAIFFWLGFINYNQKNNPSEAFTYLEEFERRTQPNMAPLTSLSHTYLSDLKKKMSIS